MHRLRSEITQYKTFRALPLDTLHEKKYSIYVIDYDWNYLFANTHSIELLGGFNPVGKNVRRIWKEKADINFQPVYNLLKDGVEKKRPLDLKSRSPVTKRAIEILGQPLDDCYYFSVYELPDKESLMQELKTFLKKRKS